MSSDVFEEYIDLDEVGKRMGLSRRKLENMLVAGQMPKPVRFGRARRWSAKLVSEWMREEAERAAGIRAAGEPERRGPGRPRSG